MHILLSSRFSMWMAWGPKLVFFYNDAYRKATLGEKHPWALGRPARQAWSEIWDEIGPRIQSVLDTGVATWDEGLLLFLERSGFTEETYHTFSYSPLKDDNGKVAGMLCVVTEETNRVLGERQLASLKRFASELGAAITEDEVPHLFERFRRVEGAHRRTHEGSGIGLALVHELVGLHGGAVDVETAIGNGTTFTVTLR
ncbi:MAG: ATP-binding protein, partial [Alloacidobacterium sp.]